MASLVFRDMSTLPQPDTSNNVDDERQGIDLAEDSCTLGHVLSLRHPASCTEKQFKVESIRELGAVLEATTKYTGKHSLRGTQGAPRFSRNDPVRIYALACQLEHGCRGAAWFAARHTLTLPTLMREYVPELDEIHAGKLFYCIGRDA